MNIEEIKIEAKECLKCQNPNCVKGCPLKIDIPKFINQVCSNELETAYQTIINDNYMGYVCGIVCPHEKQCQGNCIKGIKGTPVQIGKIEAGICEYGLEKFESTLKIKENKKEKIAIIGGGPSGISCALELRKKGYQVTIFEKNTYLGGILIYGIPEYRLPKNIISKIIEKILSFGISIETNKELGKDFTINDLLKEGYNAVYLAIGNEKSKMLNISGVHLNGVFGANEFLKDNIKCTNKKVIVIGGGNVAMDVARVSKRNLAKEVTVVYRKKIENMPANKSEIEEAIEESVNFVFEKNIIEIIGDKQVSNVICEDGTIIEADFVVMAIGALPNNEILNDIKFSDEGLIMVDENFKTNLDNVYAGGDLVQNKSTVCMAIKNGKDAAKFIDKNISKID